MNYRKINRLWQSSTLFLAPILLVVLIWLRPSMSTYQWLLWLHLPALMVHESEEYVLAPMSFKEFFNLRSPLGSRTDPDIPLDEGYVFQVNVVIAWPMIIAGALLATVAPWVGMAMIWFELIINNAMHTIGFQGEKPSYNPGLLTNSLVLLPYGTWVVLTATRFFTPLDWGLSALVGLAVAALLGAKTRSRLVAFRATLSR